MLTLTSLISEAELRSSEEVEVYDPAPRDSSRLRYAFLSLLAANIFVISGAASFALFYFFR